MKVQLIRNATLKIFYAGKTILLDPMLSPKGSIESFAGIEKNPTLDLPLDINQILDNIDLVLVTHTHTDHFDDFAKKLLPKDIELLCQPCDKEKIESFGFSNVKAIENSLLWNGITISRTNGKHGSGEILKYMGTVSGFVLQAQEELTTYIVGDSIWVNEVESALEKFMPSIIITNSGGAYIPGYEKTPILMNENETLNILRKLPNSKVIAVHMESLDHCTVTRKSLKESFEKEKELNSKLYIPNDGEIIDL